MANLSVAMLADAASKKVLCLIDAATNGVWALRGLNGQTLGSGDKVADLAVASDQLPAALGQAAMAASLPVVVASDQGAVPVNAAGVSFVRNAPAGGGIAVAASTEVEVVTSTAGTPAILDGIELTADHHNVGVRIYSYNGATYDILDHANSATTVLTTMAPGTIGAVGSWLFDVLCYDVTNTVYKLGLKRAMTFPQGFKVAVYNMDAGGAHNCQCRVAHRYLR